MKLVQTVVANNFKNIPDKKLIVNKRWGVNTKKQKQHWYTYVWSVMSGFKNNKNIHLYCDDTGAKISDILHLPYKTKQIVLNDIPNDMWALAKIKTYSLQDEPFLHYDYDVIFQNYFPKEAVDHNLYVQNFCKFKGLTEFAPLHYINAKNLCHLFGIKLPDEFQNFNLENINNLYYANSGLFGGNDIELINEYSRNVLNALNEDVYLTFQKLNGSEKLHVFSLFEEIYPLLLHFKKYNNYNIGSLLETTNTNIQNIRKDYEAQSKKLGYIHLMGLKYDTPEGIKESVKRYEFTKEEEERAVYIISNLSDKIEKEVKTLYPEHALIIEKIFHS